MSLQHARYVPLPPDAVRQGTPEWHRQRQSVTFTGSTPGGFTFVYSESGYFSKYCRVVMKDQTMPDDFDDAARARMQWGTDHEDCAVLTFLEHFPKLQVREATFMPRGAVGASPDGLVYRRGKCEAVLEIKCPSSKNKRGVRVPHTRIPTYYFWQLVMEMHVADVREAYFVSWGEQKTNVWHVRGTSEHFDALWAYLAVLETAPEGYVRDTLDVGTGYQPGHRECFVPGTDRRQVWRLRCLYADETPGRGFADVRDEIKAYDRMARQFLADAGEKLGTFDSKTLFQ